MMLAFDVVVHRLGFPIIDSAGVELTSALTYKLI